MTGTPPATNADASPRSSSSDGGGDAVSDAAARASEAGDAGASGDGEAGMDLDTGSASTTFTLIDTTVTAVVQGQAVTGWDPIPESSTINLGKVGTALSIRANTTPATVGSVGFVLDGTYMHTEDSAPYTLCGDNGTGTVSPCPQLVVGSHTLIATPYSAADLGGTAMPSTTLYFKMVDDADGGDGG
jgi:hypothetical protein